MATQDQKIEALADFLEYRAGASVSGHTSHDGIDCEGHGEAFDSAAATLLELIESNYGYDETAE